MPEIELSPAWQEQPGAFPVFCTLHLSPMEGRSPAWKCADSFQSCKTKLFHPKDSGCSASCPSASLNSDQISHQAFKGKELEQHPRQATQWGLAS